MSEVCKSNRTVARGRGKKLFIVPFSLIPFNKTQTEVLILLIYSAKPKLRGQMKVVLMLQTVFARS